LNNSSNFSGSYVDLTNKPTLFSGSYDDLTNKPTIPEAVNLTGYATETYVTTAISNLIDTAPTTLNTLDKLAAALNDDASFSTTVTTALGNKAPNDSPTFTGTLISSATSAFGPGLTQSNLDSTPGGPVAVNVKGLIALTEGSILFYKPSGFENAVPFGTILWSIGKTNFNDDFAITNQTSNNEVLRIDPATGASTFYGSVSINGLTVLQETTEILNTKTGATGVVEHDCSTGAVWYHSSISSDFTANFTNLPTINNRTFSIAILLSQGATARIPNAVQIGGVAQTIKWSGGFVPSGTNNNTDIVNFTLLRISDTWTVLGSLSTFG
jgi:hypothetical protein